MKIQHGEARFVALLVTSGGNPNFERRILPEALRRSNEGEENRHKRINAAAISPIVVGTLNERMLRIRINESMTDGF